jgi:cell division topological specificity factor
MVSLFDRIRGRTNKRSAQDAKQRLQFILFHDRIDLPPEHMEAMKREILEVISKYVSIEQDRVDIALQQRQRDSLIVAEIPFSKATESGAPDEILNKPDDKPEQAEPAD